MKSITLTEKDIARFWSKVDVGNPDECWEWQGYKFKKGYGGIQLKSGNTAAHRVSWIIQNGDIENGMCVCHKCDNPSCVNPSHLFLGTFADNNKDRALKGRSADVSGENNPSARLSELDVIKIKELRKNSSQRNVAKLFGVGKTTIARIDHGLTWRFLKNGKA